MSGNTNYTYTVIIPHRNSFLLLKRALESIPDRDDIQIVVVDNTPGPPDFSYLNIFKNSKLELFFSDIEKGAGHARNEGMRRALGKWLIFLDADDFYNPGAFYHFDNYKDSDHDIVFFSANSVFSDTLEEANRHQYVKKLIDDFLENRNRYENKLRYCYIWPVNKMIRRNLVTRHNILFDEVPAANDMMFSVKIGHYAKSIAADRFQAYCVTINNHSLTRTISKKNQRSRFMAAIRQYQFMTAIGKPEQRFRLMSEVIRSLRFGFGELLWYLNTSREERVNIFLGVERWPFMIIRYLIRIKGDSNYFTRKK